MVTYDILVCPVCGGLLKHYDTVNRIIRTKGRHTSTIKIPRLYCARCRTFHRQLPEDVLPYKQYEAEIIFGVLDGIITCETLGFEDYPSEMTMARWRSQKLQLLLWKRSGETRM